MEEFADDLQSLGPRDGADDGGLDAGDEGLPREAIDVDCFDELLNAPLVDSPRNARPPSAAGDEERRLASGEVLPFETVHAWLRKLAAGGDAPRTLPLRPSASPFAPSLPLECTEMHTSPSVGGRKAPDTLTRCASKKRFDVWSTK